MEFLIDLDIDTALRLRSMAEAQNRSVEELIQEILQGYARKHPRPRIPGIGEFRSKYTDTSERAREILKDAAKKGRWS